MSHFDQTNQLKGPFYWVGTDKCPFPFHDHIEIVRDRTTTHETQKRFQCSSKLLDWALKSGGVWRWCHDGRTRCLTPQRTEDIWTH